MLRQVPFFVFLFHSNTCSNLHVGCRDPTIQDNSRCGMRCFWKAHMFKANSSFWDPTYQLHCECMQQQQIEWNMWKRVETNGALRASFAPLLMLTCWIKGYKESYLSLLRQPNETWMEKSATLVTGTTSASTEMQRYWPSQRKWNIRWMVSIEHVAQLDVCSLLLAGLIGHLRAVLAPMYRLYVAMKEQSPNEVTADEIAVTLGKKNSWSRGTLQPPAKAWVFKHDYPESIWEASQSHCSKSFIFWIYHKADVPKGPWDQNHFEELLAKWITATDQLFYMVEKPEFHALMMYTHHHSPSLKIPYHDAIKKQIMKMGEDSIKAIKHMFQVCKHLLLIHYHSYNLPQTTVEGKISISLDTWTSSNNYVFMAIVAHYITNAGQLGMLNNPLSQESKGWRRKYTIEELLIDFHELEGEHSGANMAQVTWDTLTSFGIENWVCCHLLKHQVKLSIFLQVMVLMTDNVSNNNTLVDGIVAHAKNKGISMNGNWVHLCYMPHTVYLVALKVNV